MLTCFFNGNANEAIEFYCDVFRVKDIQISRYSDMPPDQNFTVTNDINDHILHAEIILRKDAIYFCDMPPGMKCQESTDKITLSIVEIDVAEAERLFDRLKEGGHVLMVMQKMFWSPAYGMVVDKYGVSWQISAGG